MFAAFSTNPTINITLTDAEKKRKKNVRVPKGDNIDIPVYGGQELVHGEVQISVPVGKKVEHQGIRIEMIGQTGKLLEV